MPDSEDHVTKYPELILGVWFLFARTLSFAIHNTTTVANDCIPVFRKHYMQTATHVHTHTQTK
jgi:hypothetical protein